MAIEAGTKFLGIASSVDTKERRSKRINDKSEYHTIEDIAAAATAGIVFPPPVDVDTIVGQLDAENYQTMLPYLERPEAYIGYTIDLSLASNGSATGVTFDVKKNTYVDVNGTALQDTSFGVAHVAAGDMYISFFAAASYGLDVQKSALSYNTDRPDLVTSVYFGGPTDDKVLIKIAAGAAGSVNTVHVYVYVKQVVDL